MSEVMTQTTQLSADLPTITAEINAYKRVAGEAIFEIGRRLKHVKENDLAHGQWERWLREDAEIHPRIAQQMMKVVSDPSLKTSTYSHLGLKALYEIATLPPEERDREHTLKSGEVKTPDEMTVRELREVKAALKAEREAREKAEADYETVRDTLESVRHEQPRIEVRTEYVTVPDESAEERLRRYEEKFGDIEIYEAGAARIDSVSDISASLQTFSYEARALMKKYGFLAQFGGELKRMHGAVIEDYDAAIDAMYEFSRTMRDAIDSTKLGARVINI